MTPRRIIPKALPEMMPPHVCPPDVVPCHVVALAVTRRARQQEHVNPGLADALDYALGVVGQVFRREKEPR